MEWRRDQTVFVLGGNTAVACPVILEARGTPVIWITEDEKGRSLFNFSICDLTGREVLGMRDNDWVAHPGWDDIEIGSEARSLAFRAEKLGVRIGIRFDEKSIRTILEPYVRPRFNVEQLAAMFGMGRPTDKALVCTVTGRIGTLNDLTMTEVEMRIGGIIVGGNLIGRSSVAVSLS